MALPRKKSSSLDSLSTIANVLLAAFIICALYFGRELLVPFALAALLTFMFAPLVTRLQRWLGRIGAVLAVVMLIFVATGGAAWVLTRQAVDLANQLPNYKENIRVKLHSLKMPGDGPLSKVTKTVEELKKDLPGNPAGPSGLKTESRKTNEAETIPVRVVNEESHPLAMAQSLLTPVVGPLGTASLVLLLLIFMLLQREDLANRLIRLIGQGRISATSRAMDEAGSRVSKYLVMQLVVNVTYGIPVAIGLFFIGVPNAILWGALATVLRFIPYVGPWIAAAFPVLLSLAISPNWTTPLLTIGLFIVLELFSNNVMEPWLYGSSTGVSPIALILAALFWTWLWGPVGLVLATPLTVCLVVMGRHIPKLNFLSIVLSDEEPLTPAEDLYHRLHRSGEHDQLEFVDHYLKVNPAASLFDTLMIPVITAAENDHRIGHLESEQLDFIENGVTDLLDELEVRIDSLPPPDPGTPKVCCVPARAKRDEMAGTMLLQLLRQNGIGGVGGSTTRVSGEQVGWAGSQNADIVCVSAVNPTTVSNVRYLCSKLRKAHPDLRILAGMWGDHELKDEDAAALRAAGADEVVTNLVEAVQRIQACRPAVSEAV